MKSPNSVDVRMMIRFLNVIALLTVAVTVNSIHGQCKTVKLT